MPEQTNHGDEFGPPRREHDCAEKGCGDAKIRGFYHGLTDAQRAIVKRVRNQPPDDGDASRYLRCAACPQLFVCTGEVPPVVPLHYLPEHANAGTRGRPVYRQSCTPCEGSNGPWAASYFGRNEPS